MTRLPQFHAAKWDEPVVMEMGRPGARGQFPAAGGIVGMNVCLGHVGDRHPFTLGRADVLFDVAIRVNDDGGFLPDGSPGRPVSGRRTREGNGHGLDNVKRRFRLCYGDAAKVVVESSAEGATVALEAPAAAGAIRPVARP